MAKKKTKRERQERKMFEEERIIKDTTLEVTGEAGVIENYSIKTVEKEIEAAELKEEIVETDNFTEIPSGIPAEVVEVIQNEPVETTEKVCEHEFKALEGGIHKIIRGIPHYYKKFKCEKCGTIEEKRV